MAVSVPDSFFQTHNRNIHSPPRRRGLLSSLYSNNSAPEGDFHLLLMRFVVPAHSPRPVGYSRVPRAALIYHQPFPAGHTRCPLPPRVFSPVVFPHSLWTHKFFCLLFSQGSALREAAPSQLPASAEKALGDIWGRGHEVTAGLRLPRPQRDTPGNPKVVNPKRIKGSIFFIIIIIYSFHSLLN